MLTILLDSTPIPKQPVGAGVYIKKLVHGLLLAQTDFTFRILAHEDDFPIFDLSEEFKPNFIFLNDRGRGARILSEQFAYPTLIHKENAALYHGLHYSFPLRNTCPTITTIHDLTYFSHPKRHTWLKRFFFPFFIRQACKKADHILAISENTRTDLQKFLHCAPHKITTTPLGVDDVYFRPSLPTELDNVRKKYNLPKSFLLFVGLVEPRKNVPLLIRSYLHLLETNEIHQDLVIAGRWGWESKGILAEIDVHPHKSRIHFTGYIDEQDKPALYQLADCFVYPSVYEGFGLPVLEAMASGTPVITTNISSMPEIVAESGLLIPPNDPTALQNAMLAYLSDPDLRERNARISKEQARNFTWERTITLTLEAYENVLRTRGA